MIGALAALRAQAAKAPLPVTVSDDGQGFNPATTRRGAGLTNITDRLHAHGGTLTIHSTPAHGTTLTGQLPIDAPATTAPRDLEPARPTS